MTRARATVGTVAVFQGLEGCGVKFETFGLPYDRFVRCESEVGQCAENRVPGAGNVAKGVNVFDTDEPGSVVSPGIEPGRHGAKETALMEKTGRRRGKTASVGENGESRHSQSMAPEGK